MLRYVEEGDDFDTTRGIDCVMLHEHGYISGPFSNERRVPQRTDEGELSDVPTQLELVVEWMSDRCQVRVRLAIRDMRTMRTTENELVYKFSIYVFECLLQPAKSKEVS